MFESIRSAIFGSKQSSLLDIVCDGRVEEVRAYIRQGGDPNGVLRNPGGPHDLKARPLAVWAAAERQNDVLWELLNGGADVNSTDPNSGKSLLHYAVEHNDISLVKGLLALGADSEGGGKFTSSPLYIAAAMNLVEIAEALLAAGANPNQRNWGGVTPLEVLGKFEGGEVSGTSKLKLRRK